ncbi:MAG: glycosyltransferase family 39 protein [Nitrospira sp.]|nr:glycosyltransferase family 39 protein [Nitrospira sp.]
MNRLQYWMNNRPLLLILAIGLLARVSLLLWYMGTHGWEGETWEYESIANNLLAGNGFVFQYNNTDYHSYVVPVFPFLCAGLHLIGGSGLALHYIFLLSSAAATIWLTYTLALRLFGAGTAIASGLLVALEPGLIVYQSYKLDVVGWTIFLILVGIHVFFRLMQRQRMQDAVLLGLVIGIGVLSRPDIVALASLLVVWLFSEGERWRQTASLTVIVLTTSLVVISPWVVRNYLVHGQTVFMTTTTGIQLWLGNNANAAGTPMALDGRTQLDAAPDSFRERILASSELEQAALFTTAALEFITADPLAFFGRMVKKFLYFWWFTPTFGLQYVWLTAWFTTLYKAAYAIILVLAAVGLWSAIKHGDVARRQVAAYLLTPVLLVGLIHSIYFVEGRHRVMVMPLILLMAGYGIAVLREKKARTCWSNGSAV